MTALREALALSGIVPAQCGTDAGGGATSVRVLTPRGLAPCVDCGGCRETGRCVIPDEFEQLYAAVTESELVILAFPSYFDSFPAQLKAFIDRLQSRFAVTFAVGKKPRIQRDGIAFITAGSDGPQPVGDRTLSHIFAVLGAAHRGTIYIADTDRERPDAGVAARRLQEIYGQGNTQEN